MIDRFKIALSGAFLAALLAAPPARAANWSVSYVNKATLPAPSSGQVLEASSVTYVGPVGDAHRFLSAQQNHGNIARYDVTFTPEGGIESIANVVNIPVVPTLDFEGVAYTNADRNSVFLSEENNPGVHEVSLATGAFIQHVTTPGVFGARRSNRGFESLTRTLDGTTMWTGNEEALTVDGPASTASQGSIVRLLKLNVNGNSVTPGPQFAYQAAPIHSANGASRSGLNDMAVMPDGTLLTLERSAADGPPQFFSRIFEVNFTGATDVSVGATASGLQGRTYTALGKELLWSGPVGSTLGQNFEGLGLGPRLANGSWVLLGTIDSSEGGAGNTVVAFTATANVTADFNADGAADGGDFLAWQLGAGRVVGATRAEGDADLDGDVDAADLDIWRAAQPVEPPPQPEPGPAPEPSSAALMAMALAAAEFNPLRVVRRDAGRR